MYEARNLSVLAYANGFTLWHYATFDQMADVLAPGYFADADNMLRTGDHIHVNADLGRCIHAGSVVISKTGEQIVAQRFWTGDPRDPAAPKEVAA
jgi:hypothetical protein